MTERTLYCSYYQAYVQPSKAWFFVAALRSFEHVAFDRTLDKQESIFEFFVPMAMEHDFLRCIEWFVSRSIVKNVAKVPNRLHDNQ